MRLVMSVAYTVTGFFTALLCATISHDGVGIDGRMLLQERPYIVAAAFFWALAVVLDGLTRRISHK